MKRFLFRVSLAALLVGCGPSLDQVARTTQAFGVAQRCSQGPFEIHVPAFGSRWGEDVTVEARGNPVGGHETTTTTIDGKPFRDGSFSTPYGTLNDSACVLSDADRAAVVAGGKPLTMPGVSAGPDGTPPSTPTTSTQGGTVALVPAAVPQRWVYTTPIAQYHYEVDNWAKAKGILARGQDMKIVFWSERPLDLQGTTFVVTHSEMVAPNGDDKKWQAHLDEVKAEAERKSREEAERSLLQENAAKAKVREEARCAAIRGADERCHDLGIRTGSEQVAYDAFESHCEDLGRKNMTDSKCRDDGWRNDNERPDYTPPPKFTSLATTSPTVPPTTPTPEPPKPVARAADRPPPAPQAETQPPKPSEHADWVPGSWQWNGDDWVWLSGGWRVPEQDRAQKLTATAPTAPPPVRIEVHPVQPLATAVWADGYWHYAGGRWIWVAGHWAVPPRAGATWRRSTWVPEGARLRLNPGGWILR